tara:strand:+ start:199 stop:855 length:657 start_codon:yes stop_codon:yes gene_type:complete
MEEEIEIPIFPLNLVVFPGSKINLHIFEPRYREMMKYCVQNNTGFGICLIKNGEEVGDSDSTPFEIGTYVEFSEIYELPDGRYDIKVEGIHIFQIVNLIYGDLYLKAKISIFKDPEPQVEFSLNEKRQVMKYLTDYINSIAGLRGEWISDRKAPLDLNPLFTYGMSVLEIPNTEKQKILENVSLKEQIDTFISILLRETKKNQIRLDKKFLKDKTILN